jgi:hypothetical protein
VSVAQPLSAPPTLRGQRCTLRALTLVTAWAFSALLLAIRKGGFAIDAVQYGLTRPGVQPGEHRLPPNA